MTTLTNLGAIDIAPEEFLQLTNPPLLIDVRSGLEYNLFHAPKALNLSLQRLLLGKLSPLRRWVLPQWFQDLPKNEPIAVICLTAHRSPIAATQLVNAGFTNVFNVTGGMMAWKQLGLPIQTGKSIQ